MKARAVLILLLLLLLPACTRRVSVAKLDRMQIVTDDRFSDALMLKVGDVTEILKSDLPAQQKADLILKIYEKRLELVKEVLLRESERGGRIQDTIWKIINAIGVGAGIGIAATR